MPITSVGSWLPTIDEFITHWTAVDLVVGLGGFVLPGGYGVANLTSDRALVDTAITNVENLDNILNTNRGQRDVLRVPMLDRMRQFNSIVRGHFQGTRYVRALGRIPNFTAAPGVWRVRMDDMQNLWTVINTNSPAIPGFTPPLLLAAGYAVAGFTTDNNGLDAAFTAVSNSEQNDQQGRHQRDAVFAPVYNRMKQYRLSVRGILPAGHPLLASIPALTPPAGSTPQAASLNGSWNAGTDLADFVWTHPNVGAIDHWEFRQHPGPTYRAAEEQAVPGGNLPVGTMAFSTDFTLVAPGSSALFAVYAVAPTGNEKRSNVVRVVRP